MNDDTPKIPPMFSIWQAYPIEWTEGGSVKTFTLYRVYEEQDDKLMAGELPNTTVEQILEVIYRDCDEHRERYADQADTEEEESEIMQMDNQSAYECETSPCEFILYEQEDGDHVFVKEIWGGEEA